MIVTLNGEKKEFPDGISILGMLETLNIQHQRVAVELNEMIVKKDRYAETTLRSGDSVEVVSFMGGGNYQRTQHSIGMNGVIPAGSIGNRC